MDTKYIDMIQTQVVRDVVWVYDQFYYLDQPKLGSRSKRQVRVCGCGPDTGYWPDNHTELDGRTVPAVCEAHEWQDKRAKLQQAITVSGLSMPIPVFDTLAISRAPTCTHPLEMNRPYFHVAKSLGQQSGSRAASIAKWLMGDGGDKFRQEHIVFYAHHSQLLSLMYNRQDQEMRDVIQHSAVLVYWHNDDRRANGWIEQLIMGRQHGLTFVIKP